LSVLRSRLCERAVGLLQRASPASARVPTRQAEARATRLFTAIVLVAVLGGCSKQVHQYTQEPFPKKLSAWCLFTGKPSELHPNQGVIPYDLNSPLFSDYATKYRFVWMPPGTSATYSATDSFEFPVGAILSKTFAYPESQGKQRLIETRLLVHGKTGWTPLPYVWNESQTEATLDVAADPTVVHWKEIKIDYVIPNQNQCKECHEKSKASIPIGPKARNLNKDYNYVDGRANQLAYWTRIGYLKGAPSPEQAPRATVWDDPASGTLDARAKTYLDINCAHCHNPAGSANTSGLYLNAGQMDPMRLGLCKVPVSAGHGAGDLLFDIVNGRPEESILIRRMDSDLPKVMMPELGRTLIHREGVALIREWIRSMQGKCEAKPASL
jgi:uncharacterized repeat protein (TIGR03806 family)